MKDAIALARSVGDGDDISPIAQLAVAVEHIKTGNLAAAKAELEKFPERGFSGFMKPLLLGWVMAGQGRGADALAALEPLKRQSGLRVLYELHAALIADLVGKPQEAMAHFSSAAKTGQRATLRVVQGLGRHYELNGEPEKAKALYDSYLGENPDSVVLQPALERIAAGRKPAALVASAAEGVAEALFNIASTMTRENSAQLALIYGRLAIYLRPDFDLAQMLVAGILESMDRYENAIETYSDIDRTSPLYWSAQLRVAGNLEALERDEAATALLGKLAADFPDRPESLISLGDIHRSNKKYLESVAAYDRALQVIGEIEPRHWSLLYSRGISLERSNQWPRAEQDFRKALELNPEQPYVLNYLGYSWVDQGLNLVEARKMIERAVELRDAYWRVGRQNEARFQWRRALTLKPEPEAIPEIEKKLLRGLDAVKATGRDS